MITVEELRHPDQKKTACYDIDVEVDDTLKTQMNSFLLSTASQQVKAYSLRQTKLYGGSAERRGVPRSLAILKWMDIFYENS